MAEKDTDGENQNVEQKGRIIVYSILGCPHCIRAKRILEQKKLTYIDVSLDLFHPSVREAVFQKTEGQTTVPQIFFNEVHIGGVSDLQVIIDNPEKWEILSTYIYSTPPSENAMAPPDESLTRPGSQEAAAMIMKCEADEYLILLDQLKTDGVISAKNSNWFKKPKEGFTGSEFVKWVMEKKGLDESSAMEMGQTLLDQHYSFCSKKSLFKRDSTVYTPLKDTYSFAMNATDIEYKVEKASYISEEFQKVVRNIFAQFVSKDGHSVDYKKLSRSEEFKVYEKMTARLQRVNLFELNRNEKIAFFINIYNTMVIHATIKVGAPRGLGAHVKFFAENFYIISREVYSIQDIKEGVLRCNQKGLGMSKAPFHKDDRRLVVVLHKLEPLIHFALNNGSKSCPPLKVFTADGLKEELTSAATSFLDSNQNCEIIGSTSSVILNQIFQQYRSDFGSNDKEVAEFILQYLKDTNTKKSKLSEIMKNEKFKIKYRPHNWHHNETDHF